MKISRWSAICHLGVLFLAGQVRVVVDKVIPSHWLIFCRLKLKSRHHLPGGISLIISRIEEEDPVSSKSQSSCEGSTSRARANHYIVILRSVGCCCGIGSVQSPLVCIMVAMARYVVTAARVSFCVSPCHSNRMYVLHLRGERKRKSGEYPKHCLDTHGGRKQKTD